MAIHHGLYAFFQHRQFDITVDDSNSGYVKVISGTVDYTFDAGATGTVTAGQTLRFRNGKPELFSLFH